MARVNLKSKEVWLLDGGEAKKPGYLLRVTKVGFTIVYLKGDETKSFNLKKVDLQGINRHVKRIEKYGGEVVSVDPTETPSLAVRVYDPYQKNVLYALYVASNDFIGVLEKDGRSMLKAAEQNVSHREYRYVAPAPFVRAGKRGTMGGK